MATQRDVFVTNLHPSFFVNESLLPPPIELRTRDSVEAQRRVPTDLFTSRPKYPLYSKKMDSKNYVCGKTNVLGNIQTPSPINRAFLSRTNVNKMQKLLRYQVYEASGRRLIIDNQSEVDLITIMRSIYLQYSYKQITTNKKIIQEEVDRLNLFTLRAVVPRILSEAEQHIAYLKDAGRQPVPPDRPLGLSNAGSRELRSVTDVLVGDPLSNSTVRGF